MTIFDSFEHVVFERGVSLIKTEDGLWRCESSVNKDISTTPSEILKEFNLRPVAAAFKHPPPDESYSTVLPATYGRLLNVELSELQQLVYSQRPPEWFRPTQSLFYLLSSVLYHTMQLAHCYETLITYQKKLNLLKQAHKWVIRPEVPYFEFDALVTATIRAFDSTRYSLWKAYGGKGSVPNSFMRTVESCSNLPAELRNRLDQSWDTHISRAKEYRDCIQHYVDLGSSSWAMTYQINELVWAVLVRIPDNPQQRSADRFTFNNDIDALTYAWELATELFVVSKMILTAVFNQGQKS